MCRIGYKRYDEVLSQIETGTGFIASKDGEILPEYYIKAFVDDDEVYQHTGILGIKLIKRDGTVISLGW